MKTLKSRRQPNSGFEANTGLEAMAHNSLETAARHQVQAGATVYH